MNKKMEEQEEGVRQHESAVTATPTLPASPSGPCWRCCPPCRRLLAVASARERC